jgi:hypothetical protein
MLGDGFEQTTILRTCPDGLKLGHPEESSGAGRSFTASCGGGLQLRRVVRGLPFRPAHGWPRKASRAIR